MSIALAQRKPDAKKVSTDELMVFCPKCKTFETLWFTGDELMQTRKFSQEDGRVYHDCGSNEPCLLYRPS